MRLAIAIMKLAAMGGRERDCAGLAEQFAAQGHAVTLVTAGPLPAQLAGLPVTVERVSSGGWTNHGRQDGFAAAIRAFRRRAADIDALIGFDRLPGADYIFATTAPQAERQLGWKRLLPRYRALLRQERDTFGRGEHGPFIFFLSQAQRDAYRRHYEIADARSAVLPVTFGWQRHRPGHHYERRAETRRGLGLANSDTVLVQVALNGHLKGLDRVIDALALNDGAKLLVIGDTSGAMRKRAEQRGVAGRVRFLGYRDDVPDLIAASDLMVHPARQENTGTVIVESLLYGVPAVVSAECGYADHVARAGAGRVLPSPFCQADLTAALQETLEPPRLQRYRAAARDYSPVLAAEGGLERVAEAMLAVITASHRRPEEAAVATGQPPSRAMPEDGVARRADPTGAALRSAAEPR